MSENEEQQQREEPVAGGSASKRIKLAEPDLAILFRYDRNSKEETVEFHSLALALHSNYFDSLFSSGMQESETKSVTLDGINPDDFRLALEVLDNPLKTTAVTAQEMMKVAPIYNRFEFTNGLKLAEQVLSQFLEKWSRLTLNSPKPAEMKLISDTILFAQAANLTGLVEKSQEFIRQKLQLYTDRGLGLFQETFIQKIKPFLLEHKDVCLGDFYSKWYPTAQHGQVLDRPDLWETLYWDIYTVLDMYAIGVRSGKRICYTGLFVQEATQIDLDQSVVVCPYEISNNRMSNGTELKCHLSRIKGRDTNDSLKIYDEAEIGDWCVTCTVGEKSWTFVRPFSKASSLPPTGDPRRGGYEWTLIAHNNEYSNTSNGSSRFALVTWRVSD